MKKNVGFLVIVILLLSSCLKQEDFSIKRVENLSVKGMSNINLVLSIENLSNKNVSIESARFRLDNGANAVLTMILRERALIPQRSISSVAMNWALKFDNPLGAFAIIGTLKNSMSNLTVTGEVEVKAGVVKKKIKLDAVPLSQILANFGAGTDDIIKSIGI